MTIVEQAARLIDPESFTEINAFHNATGEPYDFGPVELARKKLHQSQAICRAMEVLKLALACPDLREALIGHETEGWKKLGIPLQALEDPAVKEIIANKFKGALRRARP